MRSAFVPAVYFPDSSDARGFDRDRAPHIVRRANEGKGMAVIVAFGDSNTWGYDPATGARFAAGRAGPA